MINHDTLTVVIGPSGAGKSTHVAELLRHTDAQLVRTETDRPQRGEGDEDTHVFVSSNEFNKKRDANYYLGYGSMLGYNYGLPHLPDTSRPKIVLLRAPFVPEVRRHRPDAQIVQIEAPVDTLTQRLIDRGDDAARIDPEHLELEITMGRKLANYVISTNVPFDQSFAEFSRIWTIIQDK